MRRMRAKRMRVRRMGLAAGVLLAVLIAGPSQAETLAEAFARVFAENPRLAAARSELAAVRERLEQARGGWRPDLRAVGSSTYNDFSSSAGSDDLTTSEASLRLRQNLYAGGGTTAEIRSAENLVASQEARLAGTEQDVLFDTVDVYTGVVRDQQILDASRGNVDRLQQEFDAARTRLSVGEATRTDLNQAEARYIGALADRSQAEANLANAIAAYERVVGGRPQALQTAPLPEALPPDEAAALALVENNPEVQTARARLAQAEADVRTAIARLLPSVDLQGELSYVDEPSIFTDWQRTAQIGVNVTVPLYQRGVAGSQLRQARQTREQRRRELDEVRRATTETVNRALDNLRSAVSRVRFFEGQVAAYQRALDGLRQEVLIGTRPVVDVLDAEQDLFGAQIDLARSVRDRTVAAYDLKQAVGQLRGPDMELAPPPAPPRNRLRELFNLE